MSKAIEAGIPKLRIEEAAARTQARIDSGQQAVIGVNTYPAARRGPVRGLKVDNKAVYASQVAKLERLRAERDDDEVERRSGRPHASAERGAGQDGIARRQPAGAGRRRRPGEGHRRRDLRRAGEGLRAPPGRHPYDFRRVPHPRPATTARWTRSSKRPRPSRRPRAVVRASWSPRWARTGTTAGRRSSSRAFADMGFDVDVGPLFSTPDEVAQQAVDADVHIVGVSSLAAGHLTLLPALKQSLADLGRDGHHDRHRRGHPARRRADVARDGSQPRCSCRAPRSRLRARSARQAAHLVAALGAAAACPSSTSEPSPTGSSPASARPISRAITLVESRRADHRIAARELSAFSPSRRQDARNPLSALASRACPGSASRPSSSPSGST